jgi:hypothetical protein
MVASDTVRRRPMGREAEGRIERAEQDEEEALNVRQVQQREQLLLVRNCYRMIGGLSHGNDLLNALSRSPALLQENVQ